LFSDFAKSKPENMFSKEAGSNMGNIFSKEPTGGNIFVSKVPEAESIFAKSQSLGFFGTKPATVGIFGGGGTAPGTSLFGNPATKQK
jgi:hypothetical protein